MSVSHKRPSRRPLLYGPTGKELAYGLYPSPRTNGGSRKYRPRQWLSRDFKSNVSSFDRWELVNYSQQLFAQLGNLGTAILDKNFEAFGDGWIPHYTGGNEAWGEFATRFLVDQFMPNCDRHGRHDWQTLLYLSGIGWDRDGDDVMLLTEDGAGFPKVEIFPSTRIGSGTAGVADGKVQGGLFDGNKIIDGIIFDAGGTPVGVRILGIDTGGSVGTVAQEKFQDYALGYGGNADLAYQPEWHDQGRGIPLVGRVSLDWLDLQDIDEFLKRGIKRAASIGLTSKTVEGEGGVGNEVTIEEEVTASDSTAHTVKYEEIEGGEMYYLRADGEEITGIDYETPHPNVEAYIARIERRAIKAVGWNYELIYLSESGRAATRLVCRSANHSIWKQQKLGLRRTLRAVRYALAKAMKNGFLPRNPDSRDAYFNWEFGLPAPLSVDAGNDEAADRDNLKMGTTSKTIIAQKHGYHRQEIRRHRRLELKDQIKDALEIEKDSGGKITFDRAMELLEQRTANGALASNPNKAAAPTPAK